MNDGWTELGKAVIDVFKNQPGVLALMIVVALLFWLLFKKEEIVKELITGSKADSDRLSRMLTLLEVLAARNGGTR